jgi:glucose dehydrogenase
MPGIVHSRGAGIAIALVGVVFLLTGVSRHRNGGSSAFIVIGLAFIMIGLRRLQRVARTPAG